MKKTFRMIGMACLVGAFAFAGSSCKKEKTEVTSFKVSLPVVEEASIDGDRAYIDYNDGNKMKWSKDDQIAFYNLDSTYTKSVRNVYDLVSGANTVDGYFSGDGMGDLNPGFNGYYGFYPASKVVNHEIGPRNSQTFDIPNNQIAQLVPGQVAQGKPVTYMDPSSLVMAVMGADIMGQCTMKHIFGFAGLNLKGDRAVDRIVVEDIEFPLSGTVTLDIPYVTYENAFVLDRRCEELSLVAADYNDVLRQIGLMTEAMNYSAQSTGKTMTLECGGIQLNPNNYTRFIVTLRPGALHHGFKVTVYYTEGEPDVFNKYNPESNDSYGYANDNRCPRLFCIRPGRTMNYTLN